MLPNVMVRMDIAKAIFHPGELNPRHRELTASRISTKSPAIFGNVESKPALALARSLEDIRHIEVKWYRRRQSKRQPG